MGHSYEGRRIKRIWWNGANGDESIAATDGKYLAFHEEFHGDHDTQWVLVFGPDGIELARHNCQYIASIEWEGGNEWA